MADLLKLFAVLAFILLLIVRRWNLGLILVLASLLLGLLFAYPAAALGLDMWDAASSPLTLRLVAIVILILALGEVLRRTARLDGMVHALEQLLPDTRLVLAVVPALIGLLPMAGGAMFSAPMVNHVGDRLGASPARKTFVNYWFRHVWEYVFPLYPSFLLGATLLGLSTQQAAATMWPLAAVSVAGGVLLGLVRLGRARRADDALPRADGLRELAQSIWPIALVLLLAMVIKLDLIISLLLTLGLLALVNRIGLRETWDIGRHHIRWSTAAVIVGAMVFQRVLGETGAVAAASQALIAAHVPVVVIVFAVPFVAGLLSGMAAAAFAIGFPIILPFINHGQLDIGLAMWAWTGGFSGVMMSPLHLCLALTRVYFQADWGKVYRFVAPAALLTATAAGVLLWVLP